MALLCGTPAPCCTPKLGGFTWVFRRRPSSSISLFTAAFSKGSSRSGRSLRVTRAGKSNADLCKELKEFLLSVGLPPNRVPSMKELSQHGRQDLANIVRRRGYKLIGELLRGSANTDSKTGTSTTAEINFINQLDQQNSGQDDRSSPSEGDHFSHLHGSNDVFHSIDDIHKQEESPHPISLHEKAARFVMTGELESAEVVMLFDTGTVESDNKLSMVHDGEYGLENSVAEINQPITWLNGLKGATISSPSEGSLSDHFVESSEYPAFNDGSTFPPGLYPSRQEISTNSNFADASSSVEEVNKSDKQLEINELKAMLHQKEIELLELRQQIENEKVALSILQEKAKNEVDKAMKLISEKDALLNSVEEDLLGLREVRVEYHGDAAVVEVAGSFNGWHHPIRMEADATSGIQNTSGARLPMSWSTILWLYPGVYEIKFIVDGIWKVDSQQECVKHENIENNILRVGD
ncbi:protein PTST homolog 3, chloroplastic isoform X2 [Nymphaea colorata]|uniref:protein PTST homolog 3, chloroplastic isoform X2 n=1 Tax=Nymphaea colorata TaxID=210225 RepID=UPI00129E1EA2|nr:protein PTST homolog 3, chloroplastic isoform X2 [Nymphaea colorata]